MADLSTSHVLPLCHCVIGKTAGSAGTASQGSQFDFVNFISTISWPVVALILLLVYRKQISALARQTIPNVKKVSFGSFALELSGAKAHEAKIQYAASRMDYRKSGTATNVVDSTSDMFRQQLEATGEADYAIVDLGRGKEWLDSRLFILSVLMAELRGIRAIVFLETLTDARRSYVGVAGANAVQRRIGNECPWLQDAIRKAMTTIHNGQKLDAYGAQQVLMQYLTLIQKTKGVPNPTGGAADPVPRGVFPFTPEDFEDDDGVLVSDPDDPGFTVEHTGWLDGDRLESLLGDELNTTSVSKSELRGLSERDKVKLILSEPGPFVAITRQGNRLEDLIDRWRLLNHVSDRFLNDAAEDAAASN